MGHRGRKDESRGVSRGHVPVGFQMEHERFLPRPIAQATRENLRREELQGGQRELVDVLIHIGHFLGPPGITEVPHPHTASKGSYPAPSMVWSQWLPSSHQCFLMWSKQNQKHMVPASPTQTAAAWRPCKSSF